MRHFYRPLALATLLLFVSVPSRASVFLDFEGLLDQESVLDFYNGGAGSLGSIGPDFNIVFDSDAQASVDRDAGGTGNFGNEPSPDTIVAFNANLPGSSPPLDTIIMNVQDGFGGFLSFFYASLLQFDVIVYGGFDGTGDILGSVSLPATGFYRPELDRGCNVPGDPTGQFNCWLPGQLDFTGTAHSVRYIGRDNGTAFDNVTLGSAPDPSVPEPGLVSLLGVGLAFIAARRRARG